MTTPLPAHSNKSTSRTVFGLLAFAGALALAGCKAQQNAPGTSYDPPGSTDTRTKPIAHQEKRVYAIAGVYAGNLFSGARLNHFRQENDSVFVAGIRPENAPVNMSPWYAFQLWADSAKTVWIKLEYEDGRHRYHPKTRRLDGAWEKVTAPDYLHSQETGTAMFRADVGPDTLWVAAHPLVPPTHVFAWADSLAQKPFVSQTVFGLSRNGNPLKALLIGRPKAKHKVVVMTRQHPPEITGHWCMEDFVETLTASTPLAIKFRDTFETVCIPLANPDGTEMGHWRHNSGGVDLNRDWKYFRQPETAAIHGFLTKKVKKDRATVWFGLDFHSTWNDIYYVHDSTVVSRAHGFAAEWLSAIDAQVGYPTKQAASGLGAPTSKNWFFEVFKAESVTFELGDNTPREKIRAKGQAAANEMMRLLLEKVGR